MDSHTTEGPVPRPTHEFDPDFWSKLRVDMVLMTDDCYCFRIDAITADGVISREWHDPRYLWTWNDLRECTIYRESSAGVGVGTVARERGGCIDLSSPPPREDWEKMIDKADSDVGDLLDCALASELAGLLRDKHSSITLRVDVVKLEGNTARLALALDGGTWRPSSRGDHVYHAVWCQYQCAAARQPRPWSGMTFELRREADGWRYNATFNYA